MIMRQGEYGELFFNRLPQCRFEVMVPERYAKTKRQIIKYIEEHFSEERQLILKNELERDF